MPDKQIFFDPQRKRWKRLLRILNVTAVVSTLVLGIFIFNSAIINNYTVPPYFKITLVNVDNNVKIIR